MQSARCHAHSTPCPPPRTGQPYQPQVQSVSHSRKARIHQPNVRQIKHRATDQQTATFASRTVGNGPRNDASIGLLVCKLCSSLNRPRNMQQGGHCLHDCCAAGRMLYAISHLLSSTHTHTHTHTHTLTRTLQTYGTHTRTHTHSPIDANSSKGECAMRHVTRKHCCVVPSTLTHTHSSHVQTGVGRALCSNTNHSP